VNGACDVRVRFCPPPEPLRRYFTTFYLVEVDVPDGGLIDDCLHPEWGNLRLHQGTTPSARTKGGSTLAGSTFAVTGPTSQSVDFSIGTTRMWGIGLLPLGWAKLAWNLFARPPRAVRMPLMGLRKKYHGTAVGAVLGMAVIARVRNFHVGRGTTRGEASWILEDNMPMRRMIESFGGRPYKTYRIYEKLIG